MRYVNQVCRFRKFYKTKPVQQDCEPFEWACMDKNTKGQPRVAGQIDLYKLTIGEFMFLRQYAEDTPSLS